jgi:hypothetical protein
MTKIKRYETASMRCGHGSINRFRALQKIEDMINVTIPHIICVIRTTGQWDGDAAGFNLEESGLLKMIVAFSWFQKPLNKKLGECVLKKILEIDDNFAEQILEYVNKERRLMLPCELLSTAQLIAWVV